MRGILSIYAEVLDPSGEQRSVIDVRIEETRQTLQRVNEAERERRR
jgi:hypothetical protein